MTEEYRQRAVYAVVIPSTNVVVEPDYYALAPPGVSFHASRVHVVNAGFDSDALFERFLASVRDQLQSAIENALTCEPTRLIMGLSAETFWGGLEGARSFEALVRELGGLPVTTGANACAMALEQLGVRRVGVVTPYREMGDEQVLRFLADLGVEVAGIRGLRCPSPTSIAKVPIATLRDSLLEVDGDDVDALLQVGTNLRAQALGEELETELGKPVITINAATVWHALREDGIDDRMDGGGTLLASR